MTFVVTEVGPVRKTVVIEISADTPERAQSEEQRRMVAALKRAVAK